MSPPVTERQVRHLILRAVAEEAQRVIELAARARVGDPQPDARPWCDVVTAALGHLAALVKEYGVHGDAAASPADRAHTR
jgi:hypothetical protein